ncbi:hypothetical protein C2S51_021939 [Perilla frutescens var. frutescens]|nr:hypothetical protein C2S51_021939 [Perilla frutescens var. frutescens]
MALLQEEIQRTVANFSPSLWGDLFIKQILMLRGMITASETKMVDTMNLIDTVERLGVSYHFENEIEDKLQQFFALNTDYSNEAYDLYTVALHFRLFRQHGHRISCDIFGRWIDGNGKFEEGLKSDGKGLLSLYEASYLRTRGETILDEALNFATASLKSIAPLLESPLQKQVVHALVQSLHFGHQRIEARNFISIYEEYEDKNEFLLRFAKLDYNLLQMLLRRSCVKSAEKQCRWWKEIIVEVPYTRDRVVECFFWAVGVYHEPHYSRARIMLTKTIAMISVIDDTYDAYGTIEELNVFTQAMESWNVGEIERLPEYMKPLYKVLLELYERFQEELANEGRSYATCHAIGSVLARSYHVEAKWFIQGYLPPFEEYLKNALISSTYCHLTMTSWLGMESATKEDFEWLTKKPKILVASLIICRLVDAVATYEVKKDRGQVATGIECYMNDNGVKKEEAMDKFIEMSLDAWKDLNEGKLVTACAHSREVLMRILNLARLIDVTYKGNQDGYGKPEKGLVVTHFAAKKYADNFDEFVVMFYPALVLLTISEAATFVTLKSFLHDQLVVRNQLATAEEENPTEKRTEFWLYFVSFFASILVLFGPLQNLSLEGITGVLAIALGASLFWFLLGFKFYNRVKPTGSALSDVPVVICSAIIKWNVAYPQSSEQLHQNSSGDVQILPHTSRLHQRLN